MYAEPWIPPGQLLPVPPAVRQARDCCNNNKTIVATHRGCYTPRGSSQHCVVAVKTEQHGRLSISRILFFIKWMVFNEVIPSSLKQSLSIWLNNYFLLICCPLSFISTSTYTLLRSLRSLTMPPLLTAKDSFAISSYRADQSPLCSQWPNGRFAPPIFVLAGTVVEYLGRKFRYWFTSGSRGTADCRRSRFATGDNSIPSTGV